MSEVKLYLGDCLTIMKSIPDKSVDAVITDPPYGLNDGGGKVSRRNGEMVKFTAGEWDDILPINWINLAVTALRDGCWITVFTDKLSVNTVWGVLKKNGANPKQKI